MWLCIKVYTIQVDFIDLLQTGAGATALHEIVQNLVLQVWCNKSLQKYVTSFVIIMCLNSLCVL